MLDVYNSQEGLHEIPRFENTGWDAICQILRKRCFGLVWIVQEVVMARKASLLRGSQSIPCFRFESIIDKLPLVELTSFLLTAPEN